TEAGAIGGANVDAFGPARHVIVLFEAPVHLGRTARRRDEQLTPRTVRRCHHEVDAVEGAARVRDHGYVVRSGQRGDPAQFGESATPVDVRLPNGRAVHLEEAPEAVARVFV